MYSEWTLYHVYGTCIPSNHIRAEPHSGAHDIKWMTPSASPHPDWLESQDRRYHIPAQAQNPASEQMRYYVRKRLHRDPVLA